MSPVYQLDQRRFLIRMTSVLSLCCTMFFCAFFSLSARADMASELISIGAVKKRYSLFKVNNSTRSRSVTIALDKGAENQVNPEWLQREYGFTISPLKSSQLAENEEFFHILGELVTPKSLDEQSKVAIDGEYLVGLIRAALALSALSVEERQKAVPEGTDAHRFLVEMPYQRDGDVSVLIEEVVDMIDRLYANDAIIGHHIKTVWELNGGAYGLHVELSTPASRPELQHGSSTESVSIKSTRHDTTEPDSESIDSADRQKHMDLLVEQLLTVCPYQLSFINPEGTIKYPKLVKSIDESMNLIPQRLESPGLSLYKQVGDKRDAFYLAMDGVLDSTAYVKLMGVDIPAVAFFPRNTVAVPSRLDQNGQIMQALNLLLNHNLVSFGGLPARLPSATWDHEHQLVFEQRIDEHTGKEDVHHLIQRISVAHTLVKKKRWHFMTFAHASYFGDDERIRLVFTVRKTVGEFDNTIDYGKKLEQALAPYADAMYYWRSPSLTSFTLKPKKESFIKRQKKTVHKGR